MTSNSSILSYDLKALYKEKLIMLCIFSEKNILSQVLLDCPQLCNLIMMLYWKPNW